MVENARIIVELGSLNTSTGVERGLAAGTVFPLAIRARAETRFFNQTLIVVQRREWPESGHSRGMRGPRKCGSDDRREHIVHNCRRTVNRWL